jgi:hypothetical protein
MRPFILVLTMLCVAPNLFAQYVYTIKADSVKITNNCDTAELILENHTQNVLGFLYNKGRGRTEFRKVVKLDDSTLIFGEDTLIIKGGGVTIASNGLSLIGQDVQLGQDVGATDNPAAFVNDREIPQGNNFMFWRGNHPSSYMQQRGGYINLVGDETVIKSPVFSMVETSSGHVVFIRRVTDRTQIEYGDGFDYNHFVHLFDGGPMALSSNPGYVNKGYRLQVDGTSFFDDSVLMTHLAPGTLTDSIVVCDNVTNVLKKVAPSSITNSLNRVTVTDANYTSTSSDYLIAYISITAGRTVNLPAASSMTNKTLIIKDESGSAGPHNITIDGFGSESIDGSATKSISTNFGTMTIYSNGSSWFTIYQ